MSLIENKAGPCHVDDAVFISIDTNEHGTIQLHPCTSVVCGSVFVYSERDCRWCYVTDEVLLDRLQLAVTHAITAKAAGFKPQHGMALYDENGRYVRSAKPQANPPGGFFVLKIG